MGNNGGGPAPWPMEHDAQLRALAAMHLPASEIARRLNAEFGLALTRNAVIGRARRAGITISMVPPGMSSRPKLPPKPPRPAPPRPATAASPPPPKPAPILRPVNVEAGAKTLSDYRDGRERGLRYGECRWPLDMSMNEATADTLFCGAPVRDEGCSFCGAHARRAFQAPQAKHGAKELIRSVRRYG